MTMFERLSPLQPYALAALRIIAALLFIEHGTMKLFGFPAAMGGDTLPPLLLVAALTLVLALATTAGVVAEVLRGA